MALENINCEELSLTEVGKFDFWKVYKVSECPTLDFIACYEHPDAPNIAEIRVKKEGGVNVYTSIISDRGDGLLSDPTADFRIVTSMLDDYAQNRLYVKEHVGGRTIPKRIENPKPGHPCYVPTAEQLGFEGESKNGV